MKYLALFLAGFCLWAVVLVQAESSISPVATVRADIQYMNNVSRYSPRYYQAGGCPRKIPAHRQVGCARHSRLYAFRANVNGPHTVVLWGYFRSCGPGVCTVTLPRGQRFTGPPSIINDSGHTERDLGTREWGS